MADSSRTDPRTLIRQYRISFDPPSLSNQWPSMHKVHFESIRKVGDLKFDTFSASIDFHSSERPWREGTKRHAEFLATRAAQLCKQGRNEEGWRLGLENEVLRRFSFEVACPKCRARVWRSEIEVAISENDDLAERLKERRKTRKPCECPPKDRPEDYYEIGTNPLFEDRAEELIIHDPPNRQQLPSQKPDRIYGLLPTKNFEHELSREEPGLLGPRDGTTVAERVRNSPFKENSEFQPLLFPFLILEAKSDSSRDGFHRSQTQTTFPIFALLKLQDDLKSQANASNVGAVPLVWFFANRGEQWRLYGCFVSNDATPEYHIMQLWDGCILDRDKSLQLVLIVDYIFDWARDIYRPTILKLLKSVASGQEYDQVSLVDDSDIFSMRRLIPDWIPPPPSTFGSDFGAASGNAVATLDGQSPLPVRIPNTRLGTLRSACFVSSRLNGVCIGVHNVQGLLQQAGGDSEDTSASERAVRLLVAFLTKWNELIVLSGDDIVTLERTWTGKLGNEDETPKMSPEEQYYFLAEFATFVDTSWDVVRQMTYLAISKNAFEFLVQYADYQTKQPGIEGIAQLARPCSSEVFIQSLECLQSGSIDQVFTSALSCTSLSLYSMPERKRADYVPPTEALGFGTVRRPRLLKFVQKIHKVGTRKLRSRRTSRISMDENSTTRGQSHSSETQNVASQSTPGSMPKDRSFIRMSAENLPVSDAYNHSTGDCARCRHVQACGGRDTHYMRSSGEDIFSAYGISLVVACNRASSAKANYDICLFVSSFTPDLSDNNALAVVVADLLQGGSIYHTIRHPVRDDFGWHILWRDQLWNLPCPFRPRTSKEHGDILAWAEELSGIHASPDPLTARIEGTPEEREESEGEVWNHLQLLLHFLSRGQSYDQAHRSVTIVHNDYKDHREAKRSWSSPPRSRSVLYKKLDQDEQKEPGINPNHKYFSERPSWAPASVRQKETSTSRTGNIFQEK